MRIPKSEKAKKTLEVMKEHRAEDSKNLRLTVEAKLKWAIEERKKGVAVIEKQMAQIQENKITIYKLDGIITAFKELLEPEEKEEQKTEEKKD